MRATLFLLFILLLATLFSFTAACKDPADSFSAPVGSILAFAGPTSTIPAGWLLCDGAELEKREFPKLTAAISQTWGGGGAKLRLPDLRGQFLRGADLGTGVDPDAGKRTALGAMSAALGPARLKDRSCNSTHMASLLEIPKKALPRCSTAEL